MHISRDLGAKNTHRNDKFDQKSQIVDTYVNFIETHQTAPWLRGLAVASSHQHFDAVRVPEESMRRGAGPVSARLKHHRQVADLGRRRFGGGLTTRHDLDA